MIPGERDRAKDIEAENGQSVERHLNHASSLDDEHDLVSLLSATSPHALSVSSLWKTLDLYHTGEVDINVFFELCRWATLVYRQRETETEKERCREVQREKKRARRQREAKKKTETESEETEKKRDRDSDDDSSLRSDDPDSSSETETESESEEEEETEEDFTPRPLLRRETMHRLSLSMTHSLSSPAERDRESALVALPWLNPNSMLQLTTEQEEKQRESERSPSSSLSVSLSPSTKERGDRERGEESPLASTRGASSLSSLNIEPELTPTPPVQIMIIDGERETERETDRVRDGALLTHGETDEHTLVIGRQRRSRALNDETQIAAYYRSLSSHDRDREAKRGETDPMHPTQTETERTSVFYKNTATAGSKGDLAPLDI